MRNVLIVFLGFLLAICVAAGAYALLPACGVTAPFLGRMGLCEPPGQVAAAARLESLAAANAGLHRQIAALERELGARQCTREIAAAPALPAPPPLPVSPEPEAGIDADAWNTGDISLLKGCWALDSSFETTNLQSGVVSRYGSWKMCFGADGTGREEMRADTGTTCSGPVSAAFDGSALVIEEPANLQCSDGGFIYRLASRCTLRGDGAATCQVRQPEVGRSGEVSFRRAARNN